MTGVAIGSVRDLGLPNLKFFVQNRRRRLGRGSLMRRAAAPVNGYKHSFRNVTTVTQTTPKSGSLRKGNVSALAALRFGPGPIQSASHDGHGGHRRRAAVPNYLMPVAAGPVGQASTRKTSPKTGYRCHASGRRFSQAPRQEWREASPWSFKASPNVHPSAAGLVEGPRRPRRGHLAVCGTQQGRGRSAGNQGE